MRFQALLLLLGTGLPVALQHPAVAAAHAEPTVPNRIADEAAAPEQPARTTPAASKTPQDKPAAETQAKPLPASKKPAEVKPGGKKSEPKQSAPAAGRTETPAANKASDQQPAGKKPPERKPARRKRPADKRRPGNRPSGNRAQRPSGTEVDEDFPVQGEYVGPAVWYSGCWQRLGLQVMAAGGGQFDAVLYSGGLPGGGWDRCTKWHLAGRRRQGQLLLEGDGWHVRLTRRDDSQWGPAQVLDQTGRSVAQLNKVYRRSRTLGAAPPPGAVVLFDGRPPTHLVRATVTPDGLLNVGASTKEPVGDFRLHMEFRIPYFPAARGQRRGNSGVYIQQRYEVQILDSFGLEGLANECGGIYRQRPPDVNMCLPPLSWQTYDIYFRAARWDQCGNKIANARITVLHNGVPIHQNVAITGKTGHGKPEGPEKLPILWQNHGNPVHFRNIWIVHYDDLWLGPTCRGGLLWHLRSRLPLLRRW